MSEKKFRCLEVSCGGALVEVGRQSIAGQYDLVQYMCQRCSKEFYMPDYFRANLSHEKKQRLISKVGRLT